MNHVPPPPPPPPAATCSNNNNNNERFFCMKCDFQTATIEKRLKMAVTPFECVSN